MIVGTEWLIEAAGCNEAHLRDESLLRDVFERVIGDLGLKSVGSVWHKFPGEGGVGRCWRMRASSSRAVGSEPKSPTSMRVRQIISVRFSM